MQQRRMREEREMYNKLKKWENKQCSRSESREIVRQFEERWHGGRSRGLVVIDCRGDREEKVSH